MGLEEQIQEAEKFDSLTKNVSGFQNTPAFKFLVSGMHKVASDFYHTPQNQKDGELVLDEKKAKELSTKLWENATQMTAVNYLKMDAEKIKALKETTHPADKESNWDVLMTNILGIDKENFYKALSGRKVVKTQEIDSLIQPIYQGFVQTSTSKMIAKDVKDIKDAQALVDYTGKLIGMYPQATAGLSPTRRVASTQDAASFLGSVMPYIPQDVPPNVAATYRPK